MKGQFIFLNLGLKNKSSITMTNYNALYKKIPVETYLRLRKESGLSPKTEKAANIGLKNSVCEVLVLNQEQQAVGMGRMIGDGGCHCQITDVCVLPEFQGHGIGRIIMEKLKHFIDHELPDSCYISLIADGDAVHLYEKFGFQTTLPKSTGMAYQKKAE
jgi:ribosomal protein S18 acetylase RimI-like enzyme